MISEQTPFLSDYVWAIQWDIRDLLESINEQTDSTSLETQRCYTSLRFCYNFRVAAKIHPSGGRNCWHDSYKWWLLQMWYLWSVIKKVTVKRKFLFSRSINAKGGKNTDCTWLLNTMVKHGGDSIMLRGPFFQQGTVSCLVLMPSFKELGNSYSVIQVRIYILKPYSIRSYILCSPSLKHLEKHISH